MAKKILSAVKVLLLGLILLPFVLLFATHISLVRQLVLEQVVTIANDQIKGELSIQDSSGGLLSQLELKKISLKAPSKMNDDFLFQPVAEVENITVNINWFSLFQGIISLDQFSIENLKVYLPEDGSPEALLSALQMQTVSTKKNTSNTPPKLPAFAVDLIHLDLCIYKDFEPWLQIDFDTSMMSLDDSVIKIPRVTMTGEVSPLGSLQLVSSPIQLNTSGEVQFDILETRLGEDGKLTLQDLNIDPQTLEIKANIQIELFNKLLSKLSSDLPEIDVISTINAQPIKNGFITQAKFQIVQAKSEETSVDLDIQSSLDFKQQNWDLNISGPTKLSSLLKNKQVPDIDTTIKASGKFFDIDKAQIKTSLSATATTTLANKRLVAKIQHQSHLKNRQISSKLNLKSAIANARLKFNAELDNNNVSNIVASVNAHVKALTQFFPPIKNTPIKLNILYNKQGLRGSLSGSKLSLNSDLSLKDIHSKIVAPPLYPWPKNPPAIKVNSSIKRLIANKKNIGTVTLDGTIRPNGYSAFTLSTRGGKELRHTNLKLIHKQTSNGFVVRINPIEIGLFDSIWTGEVEKIEQKSPTLTWHNLSLTSRHGQISSAEGLINQKTGLPDKFEAQITKLNLAWISKVIKKLNGPKTHVKPLRSGQLNANINVTPNQALADLNMQIGQGHIQAHLTSPWPKPELNRAEIDIDNLELSRLGALIDTPIEGHIHGKIQLKKSDLNGNLKLIQRTLAANVSLKGNRTKTNINVQVKNKHYNLAKLWIAGPSPTLKAWQSKKLPKQLKIKANIGPFS